MNLNCVIASVSWELIESEKGKFNFAMVDSIIAGARKENLKLMKHKRVLMMELG
jgi:GH35 family endo-1,4-beta-xylanase